MNDSRRYVLVGVVAAVLLALASTVVVTAVNGDHGYWATGRVKCDAPALSGTNVSVSLTDMGGRMGGFSSNGMMGGRSAGMRVLPAVSTVSAGTVSFVVTNTGHMAHELVIMPLEQGAVAGQRIVGADNKVDETGSLGEASKTCGEGAGEGIASGGTSWTTVSLPAGDYELICNLPGHYVSGMYAQLTVR